MSKNHSGKLSFKIHFVLIVILFYQLSGSQFVLAQSIAEDLLKNIQDKFDSINDLSAEITQLIDSNINLKGKVYYRKENHLRFESDNIIIVSDGETSWNYNKKQNKVVIANYDTEGNNIFSLRQMIYEYPDKCELSTYQNEGEKVLQLIPQNNLLSFKSVKLFITDDNLISKILIDNPPTGLIQLYLSDYKININLPDSLFSFSPPEGSQVLDLR